MGVVRPAAALVLVMGLAACAERAGGGTPPSPDAGSPPAAELPEDPAALVLRVEHTGGFVTPETIVGRLPIASVYGDGRVIVEGPVEAIYPGPAWPNVQVLDIGRDGVQDLTDRALAAGVAETGDLGMPPLADATSTRFTLVTGTGTHVREIYALQEARWREPSYAVPDRPLTDEQYAARDRLAAFLDELTAAPREQQSAVERYEPEAVAAVVRPWVDPQDGLEHPDQVWPGPPLPGEPLGGPTGLTCVTVTDDPLVPVLAAARAATAATPWVAGDGTRWSVLFRPLLPDETGCADLGG